MHYIIYILQEDRIANNLYNKILEQIYSLEYFPNRYSRIQDTELRKLLIENYIIVYYVYNSKQEIYILHIFHKSQNYLNLI